MAWTIVDIRRGREGSFTIDEDSVTMTIHLKTDDKHDAPYQVLDAPGMVKPGDYYNLHGRQRADLICQSVVPQIIEKNPYRCDAIVTYSTLPSGDPNQTPDSKENPLIKPATLRITKRSYSEVQDRCYAKSTSYASMISNINSIPRNQRRAFWVTNSAKTRFTDPPVEEEEWMRVYMITKNISLDTKRFLEDEYASDVINGDAVSIDGKLCDVATLRMPPPDYELMRGGPQGSYWAASFEVIWKEDGWIREIIDRGTVDKDGKHFTGSDLYATDQQFNLDGAGTFLAVNTDPTSLFFRTKRAVPFAPLLAYWSQ